MKNRILTLAAFLVALAGPVYAGAPVTQQDSNGSDATDTTNHAVRTNCVVGCSSASAATPASSTSLESSHIIKGSAGSLFSFEVAADSTLSAAAWYILIFNATSAPADGAVQPTKCFPIPSGTGTAGGVYASNGVVFSTGIVISVSTTGCFTKTASSHAYISGDAL